MLRQTGHDALTRPGAFPQLRRELRDHLDLQKNPVEFMDFYCDQVLTGRTPVRWIAETPEVLAFHHTQPYWPVHIVIIPKRHIASLAALEPGDLPVVHEMLTLAADLCRELTAQHGGCRLSTNSGDYQTTKHLHFYLHHGPRLRDEHGKPLPPA